MFDRWCMVGDHSFVKMTSVCAMIMGAVLLALGVAGRAQSLDRESFAGRVEEAMRREGATALRSLDVLAAEALQAGRLDLRVLATAAHARVRVQSGDFGRVVDDLEAARAEARSGGWKAVESWVNEVMADYWEAQGDMVAAAGWLDAAWMAALAASPAETDLAVRVLERLTALRTAIGQDHLAGQASAWHALLTGAPGAPEPDVPLQPIAMTAQVATDEVGRARLFLANATAAPVTGTLVVDGGDLAVRQWTSAGTEERITLKFPAVAGVVPHSPAHGRTLTLMPGETRALRLEVEPNDPPRPGVRQVTVSWQAGAIHHVSTVNFHFVRSRDLPATSVANACHVRLSPLVSVPVHMEIYHRGRPQNHVQDLLPITSEPCRVEVHELLADGTRGRQWLAVDGDGDGDYRGEADAVFADADGSGYPDVAFSREKEVAALEIRLFPIPSPDGSYPAVLELDVSLRDGSRWRQPADVSHRVEAAP